MARKKMGEILLEKKVIRQEDLDRALMVQKASKKPLGSVLAEMNVILEEDVAEALATQFGFPYAKKIARFNFAQEVLDTISADIALSSLVFPLKIEHKNLFLAMANPLDMALQSEISFRLGLNISPCVGTPSEIRQAIRKHYKLDARVKSATAKILLVDNDEMALKTAQIALVKEGYEVFSAKHKKQALSLTAQQRPDLIVTCIIPLTDGVGLFQSLQANPEFQSLPVIALSPKATAEEEYQILDLGFFDFIHKPVDPVRLQARVKRALKYFSP